MITPPTHPENRLSTPPDSGLDGQFVVTAERWSGGWDLHIHGRGLSSGGGVTNVTNLDDADAQVRRYLRSVFEADFSNAVIEIALPGTDGRSFPG
jgi:hypothetical protein